MRYLFLVLFIALFNQVSAQESNPEVFETSAEILNAGSAKSVTGLKDVYVFSHDKLVAIKENGEKQKLRKQDVWGFRNKHGETFRIVKDETYKLLESKELTIYEAPTTAVVGDLLYNDKQYYFSKGLDAPIYRLEYGALKRIFEKENPAFIGLVSQELGNSDLWRNNNSTFEIVRLYNQSLKQ